MSSRCRWMHAASRRSTFARRGCKNVNKEGDSRGFGRHGRRRRETQTHPKRVRRARPGLCSVLSCPVPCLLFCTTTLPLVHGVGSPSANGYESSPVCRASRTLRCWLAVICGGGIVKCLHPFPFARWCTYCICYSC